MPDGGGFVGQFGPGDVFLQGKDMDIIICFLQDFGPTEGDGIGFL